MKDINQIKEECIGDVFTLDEFMEYVEDGYFNSYDGDGYFHDGENETNINVWEILDDLDDNNVKDFPYVCWYNR